MNNVTLSVSRHWDKQTLKLSTLFLSASSLILLSPLSLFYPILSDTLIHPPSLSPSPFKVKAIKENGPF